MSPGISPNNVAREGQQKQPTGETLCKKQATPSQKRLQKQQRQNQNQTQKDASQPTNQSGSPVKTRELDIKVGKLNGKSENCKIKICSRLDEFAKKAAEIKAGIGEALERQQDRPTSEHNASASVDELRERLSELSASPLDGNDVEGAGSIKAADGETSSAATGDMTPSRATNSSDSGPISSPAVAEVEKEKVPNVELQERTESELCPQQERPASNKFNSVNCFEPLSAKLDPKSKFLTLKASLERQFGAAPSELYEAICNKLISLSRQIEQLKLQNEAYQREIGKLRLIKERLGDLCRELQKSNNQIRIESLDLIKTEQRKAKDQADKIQTTLAGVMKLFDENQQRNVGLRQENADLQSKLKQLLEHCENWEQCVDTALKQRDIENKLVKTEMARLSLIKNEEQERFVKEKQELLRAIETMKTHQSRVEDKEAKLRSDLSSYASKYDQCQELIQNGLGKFQVESKRMLKQIEQSRHDYVTLLNKYETSNKKIKQLLEEKQVWMQTSAQSNKKLEALERLCRSLKAENDRLLRERKEQQQADCRASPKQSGPITGCSGQTATGESPDLDVPLVLINDQPAKR